MTEPLSDERLTDIRNALANFSPCPSNPVVSMARELLAEVHRFRPAAGDCFIYLSVRRNPSQSQLDDMWVKLARAWGISEEVIQKSLADRIAAQSEKTN